jgi:hypothetical protein
METFTVVCHDEAPDRVHESSGLEVSIEPKRLLLVANYADLNTP